MMRKALLVGGLALWVLQGTAAAQTKPVDEAVQTKPVDEEERMDRAFREFGYVTGQAFGCHTKEQQAKLERTALDVGTNILRLFGSDRAFFYAAAFGAGASAAVDQAKCLAVLKRADEMLGKLKVLSQ